MNHKYFLLSISLIILNNIQWSYANIDNPKVDSYIQNQFKLSKSQSLNHSVIVMLKSQADINYAEDITSYADKKRYIYDALRKTALVTQAPLVEYLKAKKIRFRQFYIQNMITVENPTLELINAIAIRSDVAKILGNPLVKLSLPSPQHWISAHPNISGPEQNLIRIGATHVWEKYHAHGEGIVLAGQDTGVDWDHPALIHQYRGNTAKGIDHNYNWHDAIHKPQTFKTGTNKCDYDSLTPCDDFGHGTHTMGTMLGDDGHGNQIGVAPKAQWIACRNMEHGYGSLATYIECFEFFLAPYPLNGNPLTDGNPNKSPHIINNSWTCDQSSGCKGDELIPILETMKKAGMLIVVSAGNNGQNGRCSSINTAPAWHSKLTFTVGAFNQNNNSIADFSSRGPSLFDGGIGPQITAPGINIRSSIPGNQYASALWSGTSMASPHVAGAAALLWSYDQKLIGKVDETISIIEKSAEPKTTFENCGDIPGTQIPNNTYGYGLLNIEQAISSQ